MTSSDFNSSWNIEISWYFTLTLSDHWDDIYMPGEEISNKILIIPQISSSLSHNPVKVYTSWVSALSQPVSIFEVKCAMKGGEKQPVGTCCLGILLKKKNTSCALRCEASWVPSKGLHNYSPLTHSEWHTDTGSDPEDALWVWVSVTIEANNVWSHLNA